MKSLKRITSALGVTLLTCAGSIHAQQTAADMSGALEETVTLPPPFLAEIASAADFIGLVQVMDTDYQYQREFPTGGTAYLRVLIPYKVNRPVPDIIDVYEEGLHEHECYFPDTLPGEEGQRFLLFVRDNPEVQGQFVGMEQGCAITVLVNRDNEYVLQYPLAGLDVSDDLSGLVMPVDYADAHAVIEYEDLEVEERNALLAAGLLEELEDRTYKPTHGIPLSDFRQLIGEENLTRDRSLLRRSADPFDIDR